MTRNKVVATLRGGTAAADRRRATATLRHGVSGGFYGQWQNVGLALQPDARQAGKPDLRLGIRTTTN